MSETDTHSRLSRIFNPLNLFVIMLITVVAILVVFVYRLDSKLYATNALITGTSGKVTALEDEFAEDGLVDWLDDQFRDGGKVAALEDHFRDGGKFAVLRLRVRDLEDELTSLKIFAMTGFRPYVDDVTATFIAQPPLWTVDWAKMEDHSGMSTETDGGANIWYRTWTDVSMGGTEFHVKCELNWTKPADKPNATPPANAGWNGCVAIVPPTTP